MVATFQEQAAARAAYWFRHLRHIRAAARAGK